MLDLSRSIWPLIRESRAAFAEHKISAAELTNDVLLLVWAVARRNDWKNGPRAHRERSFPLSSSLWITQNFRLRSIPQGAQEALIKWALGETQLDLFFDVPEPRAVLAAQARGRRCVSLLIESENQFVSGHEGRDAFSFVLHDLIHAWHFFSNPEQLRKQIFFAQWMNRFSTVVPALFNYDSFCYLVSDMNTNWIHSLKCLKAILTDDIWQVAKHELIEFLPFSKHDTVDLSNGLDSLNTPKENDAVRIAIDRILLRNLINH